MQRSLRIDGGSVLPNGNLNIQYTEGVAPLPLEASGSGLEYESRQALKESIEAAVARMPAELLIAFAIAAVYRQNPQLPLSALAQMRGKTVTLDLTGSANAVTFS